MKINTLKRKIDVIEQAFASVIGPCYDINLSQDCIPGVMRNFVGGTENNVNEIMGMEQNARFSDVVAYWIQRIPEEERTAYLEFFDVSNLLERFENGEDHVYLKYWTHKNGKEPMLAERHLVMYREEDTGDVLAISYVRDLTEQYYAQKEEEKLRNDLEMGIAKLDIERKFLEVLSQDYMAVYHANLAEDSAEILKLEQGVTQRAVLEGQIRKKVIYTEQLNEYCRKFVVYKQAFLQTMDRENLMAELKNSSKYVYRYLGVPNAFGHQYFEIHVFPVDPEKHDGNVIIAFRQIDDIVLAERRRQKELEERLEKEKNQNEVLSALAKIYYAVFRIDLENDSYEEIFCNEDVRYLLNQYGSASENLKGLCENFIVPEHRKRMEQFFDLSTVARRLKDKEIIDAECFAKDGNWHGASFIAKRRDEKGNATHILYATRLISDEKEREEKLISIAENATEANEAKTEFVSQIAHDIRTPLNSIFGFLEIAEANISNDEKVVYSLGKIRVAGEFLKNLVNDILDISRMENGKLKLQPTEISLQETLNNLLVSMENGKLDKKLNFQHSIHDISHDRIFADPLRLEQIYSNVLSNAMKYTPDQGTIRCEVYEEEIPERRSVRIVTVIQDTGIGMSKEFMETMFQKFVRETDTRINQVSGYGLGLSIVKQLVDLMGGSVDVQSTVGKGTTFCIQLEVPYVESEKEEKQEVIDYRARCQGMHLLVAEDNALNREIITELLKMYGMSCECVEDGCACVDRFRQTKEGTYDAILMDMQMPRMNGLDATKEIRRSEVSWASTIPIIAMTANALKTDVEKCIAAGMNVHLAKPVEMEKLMKVLAIYRKGGSSLE